MSGTRSSFSCTAIPSSRVDLGIKLVQGVERSWVATDWPPDQSVELLPRLSVRATCSSQRLSSSSSTTLLLAAWSASSTSVSAGTAAPAGTAPAAALAGLGGDLGFGQGQRRSRALIHWLISWGWRIRKGAIPRPVELPMPAAVPTQGHRRLRCRRWARLHLFDGELPQDIDRCHLPGTDAGKSGLSCRRP